MQLPLELGEYPLIHFEQVLVVLLLSHIKHLDGQDKQED